MKVNQISQTTYQKSFKGSYEKFGEAAKISSKEFDNAILKKICELKKHDVKTKGSFIGTFIDTMGLKDGTRIDFDPISRNIEIFNTGELKKPILPKAFFKWRVKQQEWVNKGTYQTTEENPMVEVALEYLRSLR